MECRLERATILYEEAGKGRPLLALHGCPLDGRSMAAEIEPPFRRRKGWRRIYPDLPGMGKTKGPDWLVCQDKVLDLLVEFVDRVLPGERFCVAGLSYGGLLVQGLVHRLADRMDGLLLIVPSMGPSETRALPARRVLWEEPVDFTGVAPDEVASFKDMAVVQTQAHLETWKRNLMPAANAADGEFVARPRMHHAFSFDLTALARPFDRPTLFLLGRDRTTSAATPTPEG